MAAPWNSSTAYSLGAQVSYNGLIYERSQYPYAATSGTAPNLEMSVDDKGVDIRTWMLVGPASDGTINEQTYYFRLDFPNVDDPDFAGYAGLQFVASNAYGGDSPDEFAPGVTREYDQFTDNPSPIPDNPVCPASKCGVARQLPGLDVDFNIQTSESSFGSRTYYTWLTFNHPLYFRRAFTIKYKTRVVTTPLDPPGPDETDDTTVTETYIPDDRNFGEVFQPASYRTSANSIFTITIPEDEYTPEYTKQYSLLSVPNVSEIEAND